MSLVEAVGRLRPRADEAVRQSASADYAPLSAYSPEESDRSSRIVVDSIEGARCDSRSFSSYDELAEEFAELLLKVRPAFGGI